MWTELRHPEHKAFSVAEMLELERSHLMPKPVDFDGYVQDVSRVSSTCLVTVARNRYSVPCELARQTVSTRLYPQRVVTHDGENMSKPRFQTRQLALDVVGVQADVAHILRKQWGPHQDEVGTQPHHPDATQANETAGEDLPSRHRRSSPVSRKAHFEPRRRKELNTTLTEDRLMANAAIMGDSSQPVNG